MRRKIMTMLAALSILLLISIIEQIAVKSITGHVLSGTQRMIAMIREEAFDQVMEESKILDEAWDRQARWLEIVVNHSSTDEVRYAFSRLLAALEEHDSATAMVYAFELEGAVEHVYERQALTLENIL